MQFEQVVGRMYNTFWSQFTLSLSYLLILKIKNFKSSCYVSLTLLICQTQITLYANAQRAKETREIKVINLQKKKKLFEIFSMEN